MDWRKTWEFILRDMANCTKSARRLDKALTLFFSVEFQTLALYRLVRFFGVRKHIGFMALPLLYLQQVLSSCYISPSATIGTNCRLAHPAGIVIGKNVQIGNNVTIYQHVTLGSHGKPGQRTDYPVVEDEVIIYAGAVIVGAVRVGCGAIVGANSVVLDEVLPHTTVAGVPAREIRSGSRPQDA